MNTHYPVPLEINPLKIHYLQLSAVELRENNPRTHSSKQITQLIESINKFGFTNPVLIDQDYKVIAGHGRILAAEKLGLKEVPTIQLNNMTEAEIRAYVIADNRLAENAGWDKELLATEFQYLSELDLDFNLTITGFETAEIDLLIEPIDEDSSDEPDIPEVRNEPISKPGDLWLLGPHRVYCGDATLADSYHRLLGEQKANLIFTDPPYNVPVDGHISGLGKTKHDEFVMASGEMSSEEFINFLKSVFSHQVEYSTNGSIHYICMDWRHLPEILKAGEQYTEFKNLCVWMKDNAGMGSLYRSQHELVLVFKSGSDSHTNNIQLGKHGRYRTNVWQYAGATSFHESRMDELSMHPTVKPLAMVKDAILDCSQLKDIILDPFGGSGTTLLAAEKTGRQGYLMELDPRYVDVILERFYSETGIDPLHAVTKQCFSELVKQAEELVSISPALESSTSSTNLTEVSHDD